MIFPVFVVGRHHFTEVQTLHPNQHLFFYIGSDVRLRTNHDTKVRFALRSEDFRNKITFIMLSEREFTLAPSTRET